MRGRQVCWSDPKLQKLAKQFVPACDEVWRLHNLKEVDCLFFQGFCEKGHYGGRQRPTGTRQGIYCCTPSGRFLASVNTTDPDRMAEMLREALAAWKKTSKKDRLLPYDPATKTAEIKRRAQQFPEDGLPARIYTRDLKRKGIPNDWRATAWNVDSIWFRKDEVRRMLPQALVPGARHKWPKALIERIVRHHLVDNARGQTRGYTEDQVKHAALETTVRGVKGKQVTVTFQGGSRTTTTGGWPPDGVYARLKKRDPNARGVKTTLYGQATYDRGTKRFIAFELIAAGTRWGRTRYNFREDDLDESPIAFAIILDSDDPGRRVAPAELGAYGW